MCLLWTLITGVLFATVHAAKHLQATSPLEILKSIEPILNSISDVSSADPELKFLMEYQKESSSFNDKKLEKAGKKTLSFFYRFWRRKQKNFGIHTAKFEQLWSKLATSFPRTFGRLMGNFVFLDEMQVFADKNRKILRGSAMETILGLQFVRDDLPALIPVSFTNKRRKHIVTKVWPVKVEAKVNDRLSMEYLRTSSTLPPPVYDDKEQGPDALYVRRDFLFYWLCVKNFGTSQWERALFEEYKVAQDEYIDPHLFGASIKRELAWELLQIFLANPKVRVPKSHDQKVSEVFEIIQNFPNKKSTKKDVDEAVGQLAYHLSFITRSAHLLDVLKDLQRHVDVSQSKDDASLDLSVIYVCGESKLESARCLPEKTVLKTVSRQMAYNQDYGAYLVVALPSQTLPLELTCRYQRFTLSSKWSIGAGDFVLVTYVRHNQKNEPPKFVLSKTIIPQRPQLTKIMPSIKPMGLEVKKLHHIKVIHYDEDEEQDEEQEDEEQEDEEQEDEEQEDNNDQEETLDEGEELGQQEDEAEIEDAQEQEPNQNDGNDDQGLAIDDNQNDNSNNTSQPQSETQSQQHMPSRSSINSFALPTESLVICEDVLIKRVKQEETLLLIVENTMGQEHLAKQCKEEQKLQEQIINQEFLKEVNPSEADQRKVQESHESLVNDQQERKERMKRDEQIFNQEQEERGQEAQFIKDLQERRDQEEQEGRDKQEQIRREEQERQERKQKEEYEIIQRKEQETRQIEEQTRKEREEYERLREEQIRKEREEYERRQREEYERQREEQERKQSEEQERREREEQIRKEREEYERRQREEYEKQREEQERQEQLRREQESQEQTRREEQERREREEQARRDQQ